MDNFSFAEINFFIMSIHFPNFILGLFPMNITTGDEWQMKITVHLKKNVSGIWS